MGDIGGIGNGARERFLRFRGFDFESSGFGCAAVLEFCRCFFGGAFVAPAGLDGE